MSSLFAAIDFSPSTASVLAHAARLAEARSQPLHVLHVIDVERLDELASAVAFPRAELAEQLVADASEQIDDAVEALRGAKPERHVEIGNPYDAITTSAARHGADLLVIGARGERSQGPGVGSVAMKCVRRSPADVLVVRRDDLEPFRSIVACVDFSEISRRVVEAAVGCAVTDESRLVLLHAHSNPFDSFRISLPADTTQQYEDYVKALQQRLRRLGAAIPAAAGVECRLEYGPNYGQAIVDHATRNEVDLIALGTVGRSNLRYLLLGSTAEKILRATPCSVLAVKPPRSGS